MLALGARHGFDADHLAAIDAFTRLAGNAQPRLARGCGALFSIGHGLVVIAIAVAVSMASSPSAAPAWLEAAGTGISIVALVTLGALNLVAVLRTPADQMVQLVGLKTRFMSGRLGRPRASVVLLAGSLFALSFDTVSQAMLFAFLGARMGGWQHALDLAFLFIAGMLITDGVQGLWVAHLLQRADRRALIASRVMGVAVSALSLLVAGCALARTLLPAVDAWFDERSLALGIAATLLVGASFVIALRLARRATQVRV